MAYLIDKIVVGELQTNCYIFADSNSKRCIIIDPGADSTQIKQRLSDKKLNPSFIINTHGHPDHIGANKELNLPVYVHKDDAKFVPAADKLLNDGGKIKLGNLTISVIHTPGHTPGSICLLCNKVLFSGDTLFAGGIGRTDLPYGDEAKLFDSIKNKLLNLPDDTKVYPGHGPETTIGEEKRKLL